MIFYKLQLWGLNLCISLTCCRTQVKFDHEYTTAFILVFPVYPLCSRVRSQANLVFSTFDTFPNKTNWFSRIIFVWESNHLNCLFFALYRNTSCFPFRKIKSHRSVLALSIKKKFNCRDLVSKFRSIEQNKIRV